MSAPNNDGVNPPRKAKRPRLDIDTAALHLHTTAPTRHRPQLLPKNALATHRQDDSPGQDSSNDEGDDYDPGEPAPAAPKRRGRKPGSMSRSARESQRKLNHSRIEKARRTKINETLATLSSLVSEAEKQRALAAGIQPDTHSEKEKPKGEKEFKLDVLVKTVTYIQELIDKVHELEIRVNSHTCAQCSQPPSSVSSVVGSPPSPSAKRKRAQAESDEHEHHDTSSSTFSRPSSLPPPNQPSSSAFPSSRRLTSASPALLPVSASPCLPPISSWLPHPYLDPSSLPSPSCDFPHPPNPSSHLPTPPLSGSFRIPLAHPTQALPALSLPGPAHPSLASGSSFSQDERNAGGSAKGLRIAMPARRLSAASVSANTNAHNSVKNVQGGRGTLQSPTVSPGWTPEDESAASLLLQISSSPSTSSSGSGGGLMTPRVHRRSLGSVEGEDRARERERMRERRREWEREAETEGRVLQAETPSSLLGIGRSRERERM